MGSPLGLAIAGAIGGGILFVRGLFKWREKHLIELTPTSKIRALAMGRVEVYGDVLPYKETINAPFSNKECLYCKWTVEEYKRRGKHSSWVIVNQGVLGRYFMIKDDTGKVLVDANGAKVDIPMDFETRSFTPRITTYLDSIQVGFKGLFFNKQMRFREYFLAKGDKVYIMGFSGDNPFVKEGTSTKNENDIIIQANGKQFYYISDKCEKDILKQYFWSVYGGLFGGGALLIGCLALIFWMFGIL
jgi:hypothetical protein